MSPSPTLTMREQLLEVLGLMVEVEAAAEDPAAVCLDRERCL